MYWNVVSVCAVGEFWGRGGVVPVSAGCVLECYTRFRCCV